MTNGSPDTPQQSILNSEGDPASAVPTTLLECGIGGCSFGVLTKSIVSTDFWQPERLTSIPKAPQGVLGTTPLGKQSITVLDLRELFWLDDPPPSLDAPMLIIVRPSIQPFAILADGLRDIHEIPINAIRSFISLYVGGVKWLSGAAPLSDRVISILDLDALDRLAKTDIKY